MYLELTFACWLSDVEERIKWYSLNEEFGYTTSDLADGKGLNYVLNDETEGIVVNDGDLITLLRWRHYSLKSFMKYKNFPNDVTQGERITIRWW
jgi:hypothetical protein